MNSPPKKYRSARRDEPRRITPGGGKHSLPAIGAIQYHADAPLLSQMLLEAKHLNRTELCQQYAAESEAVIDALNAVHALAGFHAWTFTSWPDARLHPAHDVLFACFHKTLLNLYVAYDLTVDGLYGMARPHLRQSFESLMIAKYCATDPESDVFDRWVDGVDLYFTNGVLKKLKHPNITQFSETWRLLCQWSHATMFASQLSLDLETTREESRLNIAFIGVLIHCAHHLLISHILTPTIKYYADRYSKSMRAVEAKARLKISLPILRTQFGPASRRLVRDFKSTWQLKPE